MLSNTLQLWEEKDDVILKTYLLEDSKEFQRGRKRPAVIICPGGAYLGTSDREAEPVALRFAAQGYQAFVLRYTTYYREWVTDIHNPPEGNPEAAYPQPLLDLGKAILMIREKADELRVDPNRIVVCGFSAGGHLAASLGVHWQDELLSGTFGVEAEKFKPNALLLCYPVLDYTFMKEHNADSSSEFIRALWRVSNQALFGKELPTDEELQRLSPTQYVSAKTPPTFLWHTAEDGLVPAGNSLLFAAELAKHRIPYDLHVFSKGHHGLAMCDETTASDEGHVNPHAAYWVELALSWLKLHL